MSHSLASLPDTGHPPARAWTDIRYISSRKRVVTCEKTTTTKYSGYIHVCSEELGWQRNRPTVDVYNHQVHTQQKSGTRNFTPPSFILLVSSSTSTSFPPVSALHGRTYEPTISPNQTRKQACPASQSQTLEKCNGTQVQGRPRAQARPGARGQHHRAALPCEYERTSACLAWCCCCCTCSEEVHHSTLNFKRGSKKSGPGAGNPGFILGFVIRRVGATELCSDVCSSGTS
jgi:hypothetical protein